MWIPHCLPVGGGVSIDYADSAPVCNREGKRLAEESVVAVFRLTERPVANDRPKNIAAARQVLRKHQGSASPGSDPGVLPILPHPQGGGGAGPETDFGSVPRGYQGSCFPFAEGGPAVPALSRAQRCPVHLHPRWGWGRGAGGAPVGRALEPGPFPGVGPVCGECLPPALPALFDAGALEQVEEAAVLRDPAFYHGDTGLQLDVETGKGWFL